MTTPMLDRCHSTACAFLQELFEDVGAIRVARVHYDESGRSIGTGEVVFERRADAVTALKKYNNVNLDGQYTEPEAHQIELHAVV